jgi:tRNA A37 threonylcarbamoyladenosine biosynthesis protein TsaE
MRMQNPFTLTFGKEPPQLISRIAQTDEIIEDFTADNPANQVYMITGVMGYGKTVLLTSISKQIGTLDD